MLSLGTTVSSSPSIAKLSTGGVVVGPTAEARSTLAWVSGRTVETDATECPALGWGDGPSVTERRTEARVEGGNGTSAALTVRATVRTECTDGPLERQRVARVRREAWLRADSSSTSGTGRIVEVVTVRAEGGGGNARRSSSGEREKMSAVYVDGGASMA